MAKQIEIHLLKKNDVEDNLSLIVPLLPKERIEKANRLFKQDDRLLSLGGSYFIEKYTPSTPLLISKEGRPYKRNCHFSISHSGDYVIFAKADNPIGVDIQKFRHFKENLVSFTMSEEQVHRIKNPQDFFKMWSLKESLTKCIGRGLTGDFKTIVAKEGAYSYDGKKFYSSVKEKDDYSIAITIETEIEFSIKLIEETITIFP